MSGGVPSLHRLIRTSPWCLGYLKQVTGPCGRHFPTDDPSSRLCRHNRCVLPGV